MKAPYGVTSIVLCGGFIAFYSWGWVVYNYLLYNLTFDRTSMYMDCTCGFYLMLVSLSAHKA